MRVGQWMILAGLIGASIASSPDASAQAAPFQIEVSVTTVTPGQSLEVTGQGCPPTGSIPTSEPLLIMASEPHRWIVSPSLSEGEVVFTFQINPPATPAGTNYPVPAADGTFSSTVVIPENVTPGVTYEVVGRCATLLELNEEGTGFTEESLNAMYSNVISIDVVAAPEPSTTEAPTTTASDAAVAQPTYAG